MSTKENLRKLCSFYVSDIHFGTMILPYISKKIDEKNGVYTIFEKDIQKNIERITLNLNLNKERKEEIQNIDWNKKTERNNIKSYINDIKSNYGIILIMGNKKYIDKANKKLEKQIKKEKLKEMTVVNCYDIQVFNQNVEEILKTHDAILNTAGEKKIEIYE